MYFCIGESFFNLSGQHIIELGEDVHSFTHTLSLYLSFSLSFFLSLPHRYTQTHPLSSTHAHMLTHTHTFSLTRTHSHTHTHTHTRTHTHTTERGKDIPQPGRTGQTSPGGRQPVACREFIPVHQGASGQGGGGGGCRGCARRTTR